VQRFLCIFTRFEAQSQYKNKVQKMFNATSADSRYKSAVLPPFANSKTRTNLDTRIEDLSSGHQITLRIVLICSGPKVVNLCYLSLNVKNKIMFVLLLKVFLKCDFHM